MTQHARAEDEFSKETFLEEVFTDAEKFELLSAYLDDEVTEQEQCLVEHWLSSDFQLQQQYQAQLKLRLAMRAACSAKDNTHMTDDSEPNSPRRFCAPWSAQK